MSVKVFGADGRESHWYAADVMYTAKKLMLIIPEEAFQLIMQGILQLMI